MNKSHLLALGTYGSIVEYDDGTAGYKPPGKFTQSFRVRIADITGFSVTKIGKQRQINVIGSGTVLA